MSEFSAEDDPDPLPIKSQWLPHESYDGIAVDQTLLVQTYEKEAVMHLSAFANELLVNAVGENDDCHLTVAGSVLRRRRIDDTAFYFFTVEANNYCRSWTNHSLHVHYCAQEQRCEPSYDVEAKLRECFIDAATREQSERHIRGIGREVLAKVRQFVGFSSL